MLWKKKKTTLAKPRLNHRKVWWAFTRFHGMWRALSSWLGLPSPYEGFSFKLFREAFSGPVVHLEPQATLHCPRFHASSNLLVLCWYSWLSSNDRCFPQSRFEPPIAGDESISLGKAHSYWCSGITEQNTKGHEKKTQNKRHGYI